MTTKTCYDLLLSRNAALPHCVRKALPLLGAWEWSSSWCSLFFMPLDRQVIDLNWKLTHGVLYTAERLASFGYQLRLSCFCGHHTESLDHLFYFCPLAQRGLAWVQTLLSRACPAGPALSLLLVTREFHSVKLICRNLYAIFSHVNKAYAANQNGV